jgi:hypothetical protein
MPRKDELERYERTEAQEIMHLFAAARPSQEIQAPADFRAKVLAKVEKRRSRQGVFAWFTGVFTPAWAPALAAGLLLSLGFNAWLGSQVLGWRNTGKQQVASRNQGSLGPPNAYVLQASITREADLGALVTEHSVIGEQVVAFGFAAKPASARSFLIGTLYAEALAYVRSGDLDAAAQRWAAIDKELVQVPDLLTTHMRKIQTLLESQNHAPEVLGGGLALFEPFYETYAKDTGGERLTLFRMGTWLENMSLAAAANDQASLRHLDTVEYFTREMQRLHAPKGVLDALKRMHTILGKADITERDAKVVLTLVQKMQRMLS